METGPRHGELMMSIWCCRASHWPGASHRANIACTRGASHDRQYDWREDCQAPAEKGRTLRIWVMHISDNNWATFAGADGSWCVGRRYRPKYKVDNGRNPSTLWFVKIITLCMLWIWRKSLMSLAKQPSWPSVGSFHKVYDAYWCFCWNSGQASIISWVVRAEPAAGTRRALGRDRRHRFLFFSLLLDRQMPSDRFRLNICCLWFSARRIESLDDQKRNLFDKYSNSGSTRKKGQ